MKFNCELLSLGQVRTYQVAHVACCRALMNVPEYFLLTQNFLPPSWVSGLQFIEKQYLALGLNHRKFLQHTIIIKLKWIWIWCNKNSLGQLRCLLSDNPTRPSQHATQNQKSNFSWIPIFHDKDAKFNPICFFVLRWQTPLTVKFTWESNSTHNSVWSCVYLASCFHWKNYCSFNHQTMVLNSIQTRTIISLQLIYRSLG